jgi:hypothetical protein
MWGRGRTTVTVGAGSGTVRRTLYRGSVTAIHICHTQNPHIHIYPHVLVLLTMWRMRGVVERTAMIAALREVSSTDVSVTDRHERRIP